MGRIGEIFADAGLHVDKASFSEYGSMLKSVENDISSVSTLASGTLATSFSLPAVALAGVAAYGTKIASSYEDANLTLKTLYGSQEAAQEKFQWLADFAATTPFEFPELMDAATRLKAYGMDIEQYGRTIGDTAAAMGKPILDVVEAVADAQQGEFERMKEFGIKAVEITKKNYETLGASMEDVGKTALTYMDTNGKQQIAVVDRNNKEMITSTIEAIWNSKYAGAMDERSKSFTGMLSTIMDSLKAGLAEIAGYDMATASVEGASLLGVLKDLAGIALVVSDAFANMSEPMQTFVVIAAVGSVGIGLLAAGFIAYTAILPLATAENIAFAISLSAALWPATLIVGAIALVAAGLVYLDEKTGIITYSWKLMKDIFTIVVDGIMTSATILHDYIVVKIEGIKQAIIDMFPPGFLEGVGNVVNGIISQFTDLGDNIHNQAEEIRTDNQNIGTSATDAGNQVTGAAGIIASGYDAMGVSSLTAGQNVQTATGQIVEGNNNAGLSAIQMGANTGTATDQMTNGFIRVTESAGPMVYAIQSGISPVEQLKAAIAGATGSNYAYSASFIDVSNKASAAASAAISAADRIGAAIRTNINQVGEIEALAGKWNTRAKIGITSSGGAGTGEGNVRIIDKAGQYADPVTRSGGRGTGEGNVKIVNYNNYSDSVSKKSIKRVS